MTRQQWCPGRPGPAESLSLSLCRRGVFTRSGLWQPGQLSPCCAVVGATLSQSYSELRSTAVLSPGESLAPLPLVWSDLIKSDLTEGGEGGEGGGEAGDQSSVTREVECKPPTPPLPGNFML